jgi:NhaA family Na+:H+ antiporter
VLFWDRLVLHGAARPGCNGCSGGLATVLGAAEARRAAPSALYIVAGTALWIAIVQSGIHASIAGVVVAATVPARPRIAPREMKHEVRNTVGELDADRPGRSDQP